MTYPDDPIHPVPAIAYPNKGGHCLTKREYFAAMAMQGDIADGDTVPSRAHQWILYADALIAELNKEAKP